MSQGRHGGRGGMDRPPRSLLGFGVLHALVGGAREQESSLGVIDSFTDSFIDAVIDRLIV